MRNAREMRNAIQKGYTLIELIVVISLIGIITTIGIASFVSFSNSQAVESATSDVSNAYITARQRALAQIKPPQCTAAQSLRGYQVTLNTVTRTYTVQALCGAAIVHLSSKTLPPQVNFVAGSPLITVFRVPNAIVGTPGIVQISGYGITKSIRIDGNGSISVS